jgi:hypothetical protein
MNEFLQEHKRAVAVAALGSFLFIATNLFISGHYGDAILTGQRQLAQHTADAARFSVDAARLDAARRAREALEERVSALERRMQRVPTKGMLLDATIADADVHYNRMVDAVRRNELEKCALANIDVDARLGLPDAFPATRREVDWFLRGLDVVQQLLEKVLSINAEVLEGGIARVDRIDIAPVPKGKAGANGPQRVAVTFVIVGHPKAVGALREAVARPSDGRALVLLQGTERSLDVPPQAGPRAPRGMDPLDLGRTQATLVLAALDLGSAKPEGK